MRDCPPSQILNCESFSKASQYVHPQGPGIWPGRARKKETGYRSRKWLGEGGVHRQTLLTEDFCCWPTRPACHQNKKYLLVVKKYFQGSYRVVVRPQIRKAMLTRSFSCVFEGPLRLRNGLSEETKACVRGCLPPTPPQGGK